MSYFTNRKKPATKHIYANVVIWQCSDCNCWSRQEFIHVTEPNCPICKGLMKAKLRRQ